jgi:hypothetical protein
MHEERPKREELKTYSALGFKRTLKSARQRQRLEERAAQVILRGEDPVEPTFAVRREDYNQARLRVIAEVLREARDSQCDLVPEKLLQYLSPRIEREIYRQLLTARQHTGRLDAAYTQTHARRPTKEERQLFASPYQAGSVSPASLSHHHRADLLDEVMQAIDHRCSQSTVHLQTAWAEVVGPLIAQQSQLEMVTEGLAYFTCYNAPLRAHLLRQSSLVATLAKRLRQPIRQLRAR